MKCFYRCHVHAYVKFWQTGGVKKFSCQAQYKYVISIKKFSQITRAFLLKLVPKDRELSLFSNMRLLIKIEKRKG